MNTSTYPKSLPTLRFNYLDISNLMQQRIKRLSCKGAEDIKSVLSGCTQKLLLILFLFGHDFKYIGKNAILHFIITFLFIIIHAKNFGVNRVKLYIFFTCFMVEMLLIYIIGGSLSYKKIGEIMA
ncbi:hypothetical protein BDA99DRAFT_514715 [Phascolomyces articulosus]|uniref:Uncharacterized protein n=1 Tax=Phascolomyces articulosus TaxID=60185 RepID=A0AAD5JXG2_9FUNG|nr:hypothetical protein BDA99DRAFT_514715 [Phascolomyces articulosus]